MKVIVSKEQVDLFKSMANVVHASYTYYYLPFWFRDLEDGTFEVLTFDKLPNEVIVFANNIKDTIISNETH